MDRSRLRFRAALALFLAWVAALGTMAVLSGRRPVRRPAAPPAQEVPAEPLPEDAPAGAVSPRPRAGSGFAWAPPRGHRPRVG